jgi:hypothetical protein
MIGAGSESRLHVLVHDWLEIHGFDDIAVELGVYGSQRGYLQRGAED